MGLTATCLSGPERLNLAKKVFVWTLFQFNRGWSSCYPRITNRIGSDTLSNGFKLSENHTSLSARLSGTRIYLNAVEKVEAFFDQARAVSCVSF
jgi:hypothetical protein